MKEYSVPRGPRCVARPTECGERIDGTIGGDDLEEDLLGWARGPASGNLLIGQAHDVTCKYMPAYILRIQKWRTGSKKEADQISQRVPCSPF
jgi:hypothetical protein